MKEGAFQFYKGFHTGTDYFITSDIKDYRLSSPSSD